MMKIAILLLLVAGLLACEPRHAGNDIPEDVSEPLDIGTSGTQPAHGTIPDY